MEQEKQVPLMITVPVEIRDELRRIAAKRMLENPANVTSAAVIAKEIILEKLNNK